MPEGGLSDLEARFLQLCLHSEIAVGRFDRELTPYRSLEKKGLVIWKSDPSDALAFWQLAIPEDEARKLIAVVLLEQPEEERTIFKGDKFKLSVQLKGFELTEDRMKEMVAGLKKEEEEE